jgi:drug/metabolite transporter (DMT)-like permease
MEWWIYGGLLLVGLVLMAIEWRIMRKPASQRTQRERRYMAGSRKAAKGVNQTAMKVLPWIMVVGAGLVLLLTIPFWITQNTGTAWLLTAIGAVSLGAAFFFRWFYRRRRGPDWWAKQEQANAVADEQGSPRWVGSTRGGIVFGSFLAAAGVVFLALGMMNGGEDPLTSRALPIALVVGGVLFIAGSLAQRRRERER